MSRPDRKNSQAPNQYPRRDRPSLTLISGDGRPRRRGNKRLAAIALSIGLIIFLWPRHPSLPTHDMDLENAFNALPSIYQREGMLVFLEAKARLKLKVADALQVKDDRVAELADNIAVYLFPDLLSEGDFERGPALETWQPLERAIESTPHAPTSRARFLSLQAEIWNYESADRAAPALSPVASQVLRIYDALSSQ